MLLVYNERAFSVIVFPSDSPNFKKFFGRVTVLRGSVLHGYNEGLFLWSVSRQICQTFENFLEGVSFLRPRVTYIG